MSTDNQKLLKQQNLNPFETNKLHEFWINSEYALLPPKVIEQMIKVILFAYALEGKGLNKIFPARTMANEIHWAPMHLGGALVKRIAKWCKDTLDFRLSNDIKTALGTVMRQASLKDQTFYFDVVTEFRWKKGDFGDHDSCFFNDGGRRDIPEHMEKEGKFAAIRFFKRLPNKLSAYRTDEKSGIYYADENYYHTGYSRAFLCFDSLRVKGVSYYKGFSTDKTFPMIIVFNGYGYNTEQIGGIASQFLGLSSSKIGLTNNKSTSGGLYVNSDGVLLGEKSAIDTIKSYDFGMGWHDEKPVPDKGFKKEDPSSNETNKSLREYEASYNREEHKNISNINNKLKELIPNAISPNIKIRPIEGEDVVDATENGPIIGFHRIMERRAEQDLADLEAEIFNMQRFGRPQWREPGEGFRIERVN